MMMIKPFINPQNLVKYHIFAHNSAMVNDSPNLYQNKIQEKIYAHNLSESMSFYVK